MHRLLAAVAVTLSLSGALLLATPKHVAAADGEARSKTAWPKATRALKAGEKTCKNNFSHGERTVWICEKAQPCCEWEALNYYVKCGSTVTGCL